MSHRATNLRCFLASGTAIAIAAVAAPAVPAAETFGSDLTLAPNVNPGAFTTTNTVAPAGATAPVTAPSSGVLVRIRLRRGATGATPGAYAFRILTGAASPFTARPATVSGANELLGVGANSPAAIDTFIPTDSDGRPRGIPISAGERLAVWNALGTFPQYQHLAVNGSAVGLFAGDHVTGSEAYGTSTDFHNLVQGIVEPDSDADGYGDETQDLCPTDAAKQAACPPAPPLDICPGNAQRLDDCTAPITLIVAAPKPKTKKASAVFTFSSDEQSTFECALDSGGYKDCASPTRYRRLKPKRHTFRVRSTDANGNRSEPVVHTWRIRRP